MVLLKASFKANVNKLYHQLIRVLPVRRIKKRGRKWSFRNSMMADYYGDGAVRTKFEYLLQGFLEEASVPYLVNQVFCFSCDNFFPYENKDVPEHCPYCHVNFKGDIKGHLSRPDFIIMSWGNEPDYYPLRGVTPPKHIGIIRVDGAVHQAKKSTRISDYHILQAFKEREIKVFIIPNDMLLEKSVKELREFVQEIKLMMSDMDLYEKYTQSKSYEELTFCPDMQKGRYNKKR